MAVDDSFLGTDFPLTLDQVEIRSPDRSHSGKIRELPAPDEERPPRGRGRPRKVQRADTAVGDDAKSPRPFVDPEDARRAQNIIDEIGKRFSENREKNQSTAYEQYQRDISDNAAYIIKGGFMTMKELSELLMKLEEYRKRTSDSGKSSATLLAEWLRGETAV